MIFRIRPDARPTLHGEQFDDMAIAAGDIRLVRSAKSLPTDKSSWRTAEQLLTLSEASYQEMVQA